ncbi:MAG: DsrE/DsrF/DrsH-like family protein [Candidatus Aerophobetes bacterium]|nr:DsrE/DsrF/DrsH-like family protein [Candidatus Aerophobetes bacterium]
MKKANIIVHSGDLDKVYSALIIGKGALAMGLEATLFFTFWGLERLKKKKLDKAKLSRMNFLGLGRWIVRKKMKKANLASLEKLLKDYKELGGKIIACEMTMGIMNIRKEDLREEIIDEYGAVGKFIQEAKESKINLFI